jgi:hypothetical protein
MVKWTPQMDAYLSKHYETYTAIKLAEMVSLEFRLNVNKNCVKNRLEKLGMRKRKAFVWNQEADQYLIDNQHMSNYRLTKKLSELVGLPITKTTIQKRRGELGLIQDVREYFNQVLSMKWRSA